MTIKEYLRINKKACKAVFVTLGTVFTSIFAVLFMIFAMDNKRELVDAIYLFIVCFVLGNFLAVSFSYLALMTGYSQVKSQIQLYLRIPSDLKADLKLLLLTKPLKSRFSFMELEIIGYDKNSFIHFDYDRNERLVWITIRNIANDIADFNAIVNEIDQKYKKDSVFLSGWGLRKQIKWKHWLKMTEEDVKNEIIELYRISEKENLRVQRLYYKLDWPNPVQ